MNRGAYFNSKEYVEYLKVYCHPYSREGRDRVVGCGQIEFFLNHLDIEAGSRVLEIGCGLGRVMRLLQERYDADVWGCDLSEAAIEEAKRLCAELKNRLFVSPAESIDFESRFFDFLILWGLFEMTEQRHTLIEVSRLLKIGGKALLCSVKNRNFPADDTDSLEAKRAYIEKGFPITYTDIEGFERLVTFLGFKVEKRFCFIYKSDVTENRYVDCPESADNIECSDIYYILKKIEYTPLDEKIQFLPEEL